MNFIFSLFLKKPITEVTCSITVGIHTTLPPIHMESTDGPMLRTLNVTGWEIEDPCALGATAHKDLYRTPAI